MLRRYRRTRPTLQVALLVTSALGSALFAVPPLPSKYGHLDTEISTTTGAVGAMVAIVALTLHLRLPHWESEDEESQSWRVHCIGAAFLVAGLVLGVFGLNDVATVGSALWTWWFVSGAIALTLTVVAAVRNLRRKVVDGQQAVLDEFYRKYPKARRKRGR